MNKLITLFQDKKENILNLYFTAGFPYLDSIKDILQVLEKSSVDIIEIGLPYSDPIADGITIQKGNQKALQNGMTPKILFNELKEIKDHIHKPYLLMGYYNSMLQYGLEFFFKDAKDAGVSGLIFPDMAIDDFQMNIKPLFEQYDLCPIFLVTPETSKERLILLDSLSKGFLYLVSSSSTTGFEKNNKDKNFVEYLKNHTFQNPILIGFGIKDYNDFTQVCKYANGGIIGSAYINAIENCKNIIDIQKETNIFLDSLQRGI